MYSPLWFTISHYLFKCRDSFFIESKIKITQKCREHHNSAWSYCFFVFLNNYILFFNYFYDLLIQKYTQYSLLSVNHLINRIASRPACIVNAAKSIANWYLIDFIESRDANDIQSPKRMEILFTSLKQFLLWISFKLNEPIKLW